MEIKSISKNIFKTKSKIENNGVENKSNQTNPFGVNFKGNMITADVFDSSNKSKISFTGANLVAKAANKSKMLTSAVTGSINSFNQNITRRLDSMVSSVRKVGENTVNFFREMNEKIITWTISDVKDLLNPKMAIIDYSPRGLDNQGVPALRGMLENVIAARGSV